MSTQKAYNSAQSKDDVPVCQLIRSYHRKLLCEGQWKDRHVASKLGGRHPPGSKWVTLPTLPPGSRAHVSRIETNVTPNFCQEWRRIPTPPGQGT